MDYGQEPWMLSSSFVGLSKQDCLCLCLATHNRSPEFPRACSLRGNRTLHHISPRVPSQLLGQLSVWAKILKGSDSRTMCNDSTVVRPSEAPTSSGPKLRASP
ncbi:hypothetical protein PM082_008307 [Marasmius tenuissimus]|nr:hypothetical protein PM082_008307 [Marasmius tenuissimus]